MAKTELKTELIKNRIKSDSSDVFYTLTLTVCDLQLCGRIWSYYW